MLQMLLWREFFLNMFSGWNKVLVPIWLFVVFYFPISIYHEGMRFVGSWFAFAFSFQIFAIYFFGVPPIVFITNLCWKDSRDTQ